jgi:hypothetical protein
MRVKITLLVMCGLSLTLACPEQDFATNLSTYGFTDNCELVLKYDKEPRRDLVLHSGQLVRWCNDSGNYVTVQSTDPRVMSGRRSIRLAPGECTFLRVLSGSGKWDLKWTCWAPLPHGGILETGGGGSPGRSEEPPDEDD